MDVNRVSNKARKSISNYCIGECKSFCCRKGFLIITQKESDLITGGKTEEFEKSGLIIEIAEKSYVLDLGKTCPSFKDSKCTIHTNPERPTVCKEYPIFIEDKSIRFSEGCPAVRNKMLYPYEKQFLELGYKLVLGK